MDDAATITGDRRAIRTADIGLDQIPTERLDRRFGRDAVLDAHRAVQAHGKVHIDETRAPLLEPGDVGDPIGIDSKQLTKMIRSILSPKDQPNRIVWHHRGSRAIVHLNRTRVQILAGAAVVGVTLETAETGREELTVPFALGSEERPTGMLIATERTPRGHRSLAELWGEGVIALAWKALLDIGELVSIMVGGRLDDDTVRTGALVTDAEGRLLIVPQARHPFELANLRLTIPVVQRPR